MKPKITIAIPAHNNEGVIVAAMQTADLQEYPLKEILVLDDCSTDKTFERAINFKNDHPKENIRVISNLKNEGIGKALEKLMQEAKGKYIVYLCGDDIFINSKVVGDIVRQFDNGDSDIGVIGRYCYYFNHGHDGAIGVNREKNILINSCCPSGMAFRKDHSVIVSSRIFCEMPSMVKFYLEKGWRWTMFEYDTVACRFLPGVNTGTKKSYYTESPWQNWVDLTGDQNWKDYPSFIMLKNRAPKILWREICLAVRLNKDVLKDIKFYVYALTAVLLPGCFLRPLTKFYRHRIARMFAKIIERGDHE